TPHPMRRSAAGQPCAGMVVVCTGRPYKKAVMPDNTMAAPAAPMASASAASASAQASANSTTFAIILSLSFCHLLNDMMQSLVPALYPILKDNYALSFSQIGLITLAFQFTASMLQ